ncbi:MAG: hypothetical protein KAJ24_07640 [Candidatus Aenigmarchaeota archaeon]|nr:hypothetical protein [Candidatus Aenigmarchaeota archaeon]
MRNRIRNAMPCLEWFTACLIGYAVVPVEYSWIKSLCALMSGIGLLAASWMVFDGVPFPCKNKLKEISSLCKRCNGYWTGYALSILFCIFLHFYAKIPSFNFSNSFILLLASFLFGVPTMLQGRRRRKEEEDYSNEHVFSYGFYAGIGTILSFIAIYSLLHNVPL